MKNRFLIFTLLLLLNANISFASVDSSTGFIPGQIWYSKDNIVEGDTIKIYTAIWNANSGSLGAKIEFYDKNVVLGSRDVTVAPYSLEDVSISWKVTSGDHNISAKIISSNITISGKKENIILESKTTSQNYKFVPISVKKIDGSMATTADVLKSQVGKISSNVTNSLPLSVGDSVSKDFGSLDNWRESVSVKVDLLKKDTESKIDLLNNPKPNSNAKTSNTGSSSLKIVNKDKTIQATDKPIAYVRLFLLSVLSFVFYNTVAFYGVIILIVFYILRFIYRKIRNK